MLRQISDLSAIGNDDLAVQSIPKVTSEKSGLLRKSLLRLSAVSTGIN